MAFDGRLQLLDVLGSTLAKRGLCLTVPLLPLLGGSIDLMMRMISGLPSINQTQAIFPQQSTYWLTSALALLNDGMFLLRKVFSLWLGHGIH